jgi:hypothetical protein
MTLLEMIQNAEGMSEDWGSESPTAAALKRFEERLTEDAVSTLINEAKLALNNYPNSREKSLVLTKLDEAELWMTKVGK